MPKTYKKELQEIDVIDKILCDYCEKEVLSYDQAIEISVYSPDCGVGDYECEIVFHSFDEILLFFANESNQREDTGEIKIKIGSDTRCNNDQLKQFYRFCEEYKYLKTK